MSKCKPWLLLDRDANFFFAFPFFSIIIKCNFVITHTHLQNQSKQDLNDAFKFPKGKNVPAINPYSL
jgi:hypothetical protein